MTVQKSLPASWAKVRKVYKVRKWFRGRLDCFFFSSDSESLYASTREQHGVGWGSVAGLTENKTKPSSWGLAELGNIYICLHNIQNNNNDRITYCFKGIHKNQKA